MINLTHTQQKIKQSTIESYPFEYTVIDDFLDIKDPKNFYNGLLTNKLLKESQMYDTETNGSKRQFNVSNGNIFLQNLLDVFSNSELSNTIAEKFFFEHPLYPDATFEGGGLTFSPPGTFLRYHGDFNYSSKVQKYRVINAILYLNYDYKSTDGGQLHLLDPKSDTVERIVEPVFNRCVLFKTSKETPHGVSRNNNDFTRISFNSYFYADLPLRDDEIQPHRTLWK